MLRALSRTVQRRAVARSSLSGAMGRTIVARPHAVGSLRALSIFSGQPNPRSASASASAAAPTINSKPNLTLGEVDVLNLKGQTVRLASLFADRRIVLAFVAELTEVQDVLREKHNTSIVLVGNGSLDFAQNFERNKLPKLGFVGEVYTDPSRVAYNMFHLKRGVLATLNPSNLLSMLDAKKKYDLPAQQSVEGDAFQQGGLFVLGPEHVSTSRPTSVEGLKSLLFSYANANTGDHAKLSDVVSIIAHAEQEHAHSASTSATA